MIDPTARRAAFQKLHERGCFVLPNLWDVGSARYLAQLGFPALATTSSGFAFSRGLPDSDLAVPRDMALAHVAEIVAAVDIPVNADFTAGYARDPEGVAANVLRCVDTGVAGLSIEDATGDPDAPLFDLPLAARRVAAARAAVDASGTGVVLTARAECFLTGHPDPLRESIRRLEAYAAAGADVLFAPGLRRREDIEAVVAAVAPRPVNVLQGASGGLSVADLAALGVRRISVGSALARAAWTGFARAARALAEEGSFAGFEGAMSVGELNALFHDPARHGSPRTGPAVR
jgi:2-methylisocitrate lyase-like PEP mutase family enzyme